MKNVLFILVAITFSSIISCSPNKVNETFENDVHYYDTLKIPYLDTFLLGHQIFPNIKKTNEVKNELSEKILLTFLSGGYYYIFFNKNKIDFLTSTYWDMHLVEYMNYSDSNNLIRSRFDRLDYTDGPFLTGFYNPTDSIIVTTSSLIKTDLDNVKKISVRYFSTSDTLLKLKENISVGVDLKSTIEGLNIPVIPELSKQEGDFKIVLLEATSQVKNAWYNNINDCCSDYSVSVILSFKGNKLFRIEYLDYENMDDVFKQNNITVKDIHMH